MRKRRIGLPGRGKRGGARVIALYLGEDRPVYAVFIFAKNEREDLSSEQKRIGVHAPSRWDRLTPALKNRLPSLVPVSHSGTPAVPPLLK